MLLTSWLVLTPSNFPSFTRLFPFPSFLIHLCVYLHFVFCAETRFTIYFSSSPFRLSTSPPPTTIYLFPRHILPSSLYPSILSSFPCGPAALTCICLAWMSPRFGLNAPIILLNYDVLLWAVLLRLCGSLMKAGTAQQNHLQRPD